MKNEIVLFENQNIKLEVNLQDETVWLNTKQIAELFDRDYKTIRKHINNALNEELQNEVVVAKFATTTKHGAIYNKNGTEAQDIIKVINNYSNALTLLDDYGHKTIIKPKGTINKNIITYKDCIEIINKLRFHNDSNLFALERNEGLKEIIGTIYQTFSGNDLYPTTEEKAANFLYLIIKNHTFIDGNKRIAATLFIYFLDFYNILYKENKQIIDNNTLVAITLLIAQSNPKEKEILIDLIMNFLI